jgi:3-methyl-2-oxobutanoate hydroxymethyltransferase
LTISSFDKKQIMQTKKTIKIIQALKQEGKSISMLTAYDFTTASLLDAAGVDMILVGDSLSNVFMGNETTIAVTVEQMIYHAKAVMNGVKQALVVVDMPFGSYQISDSQAVENAIHIFKHSAAHAVKLEGGIEIASSVQKIVAAGIPVMGHLGLTPQSIHQLGSYEVQAKTTEAQINLMENAKALEAAGCFAIVLEKVPKTIATEIALNLKIPVIGIGAGNGCNGQVLVINDLLGMNPGFKPKFVRKYTNLHEVISEAVSAFIKDVQLKDFPNDQESY